MDQKRISNFLEDEVSVTVGEIEARWGSNRLTNQAGRAGGEYVTAAHCSESSCKVHNRHGCICIPSCNTLT